MLLDREDGEEEEEEKEEERDEGDGPIISEESIRQVVSSSQSFRQDMIDEPLGLYNFNNGQTSVGSLIPRLHYQPVSSRFSSCALTSPVSTSVCVYTTTARTGLNQRQLVRLFHSTVAGSRAVPKHVRACR